jgi:anhydro-N-acetylmuramic acid kinase
MSDANSKSLRDLFAVGVMTGNSLDGVDVVLTRFSADGEIEDVASHSIDLEEEFSNRLRAVRTAINESKGDMNLAVERFGKDQFLDLHRDYLTCISSSIVQLRDKSKEALGRNLDIDVIGLHGQTCAHLPPSVAKSSDPAAVYTVQIGNGQELADAVGIPVVFDFRSDDIMNGGEGAPLAPMHHFHLAASARKKGQFPLAFCNAGNTGNVTVISQYTNGDIALLGWDTGPFNNYPDHLMQTEREEQCDVDGSRGKQGQVNMDLLRLLFEKAVVTASGENFLLRNPPKSSDPQWYLMIPELLGKEKVNGELIPFNDRLRTAEYFSAYVFVHSLTLLPESIAIPRFYAISGGGWRNPVSREHFEGLLQGLFDQNPVLSEHQAAFRLWHEKENSPVVDFSEKFGYDSKAMEARIFADAAVCRLAGVPFTTPGTTGCRTDTMCGVIRFPGGDPSNCSATLQSWLEEHKSRHLTCDFNKGLSAYWSRASAGWHKLKQAVPTS